MVAEPLFLPLLCDIPFHSAKPSQHRLLWLLASLSELDLNLGVGGRKINESTTPPHSLLPSLSGNYSDTIYAITAKHSHWKSSLSSEINTLPIKTVYRFKICQKYI